MVNKECQHHQECENYGKMPITVTEVVLEFVALVLERVESLVLNLPPGPTSVCELLNVFRCDGNVGNPTKGSAFSFTSTCFALRLKNLEEVNEHLTIFSVEWDAIDKAIDSKLVAIAFLDLLHLAYSGLLLDVCKHRLVVAGFSPQNEGHPVLAQFCDVGRVRGQAVLNNDDRESRMFTTNVLYDALTGIAFAVIIGSGHSGITTFKSGCINTAANVW